MSRALQLLAEYRLEGKKPAHVWITICDDPQPEFWRWSDVTVEIHAPNESSSVRMDWRPVVGCDVILIADERTPTLKKIIERLCLLVKSMSVSVVSDLPENPGHLFVRGLGWRAI